MFLQLAWRNIGRNRRRTIITASSIAFAVLFAGILQSLEEGSWENIIDNVISSYTGNIQIHKKGYHADPTIDNLMDYDQTIKEIASTYERVEFGVPRLESFGLASTGDNTRAAFVAGVDPILEDEMTNMAESVVEGTYLTAGEDEVMIGDGLANILGASVGDTIILVSQGYHGSGAAGRYVVKALLHFPTPQLNRQMVVMPLTTAQEFFDAHGLINTYVLRLNRKSIEDRIVRELEVDLDTNKLELLSFEELMPDLIKTREIDTSGNYIIYSVLYLIISFGVFSTLLMMLRERRYEFGLLLSLGMLRREMFTMVWLELLLIAGLGVIVGIAISFIVAVYFHLRPIRLSGAVAESMEKFDFEPIIPASIDPMIFVTQALIVLVICMIIIVYPAFYLRKLEPIAAMRA